MNVANYFSMSENLIEIGRVRKLAGQTSLIKRQRNRQYRTLAPNNGLEISMRKMFFKLLVGLCCVLLNALILMSCADRHTSAWIAIAEDTASKTLWHPILHTRPYESDLK